MKLKFTLLLFLIVNFVALSQTTKFKDIVEVFPDKSYKLYLNDYFKPVKKDCGDFYMECKLNNDSFVFEDTLKVYYKSKKIYTITCFSKGVRNGIYNCYHKNGTKAIEGQYRDGKRDGIWKDYYENGSLRKIIDYHNDTIVLMEFYDRKGQHLVKNGNGYFKDEIVAFALGHTKSWIEGNVVEGTLDGEWLNYVNDKLVAKEKFTNNKFINGISYTISGTQSYSDQFYSTFLDILFDESIGFGQIETLCGKASPVRVVKVRGFDLLKPILKNKYSNMVRSFMPKNYWFFAGLLFDGYKLKEVSIISPREDIDKDRLAEFIKQNYDYPEYALDFRDTRSVLPMVIVDGQLFLQGDSEIPLLSN